MNNKTELVSLVEELEYAKKAVEHTLKDERCLVDWHGLAYWASEVERLRKEVKGLL